MKRSRMLLGWVTLLLIGAAPAIAQSTPPTTGPTTEPANRRTRDKTEDPIAQAARELSAEAQEALKEKRDFPRTASDFYTGRADVPAPELIVASLSKRLGRSPQIDAYVKWQLLSGLPEKLDPSLSTPAARALVEAPAFSPLPGISAQEKRDLDKQIRKLKEAEIADANAQWGQAVDRVARVNDVILNYREALSARLPNDPLAFKARLEDLWTSAAAGIDSDKSFKTYTGEVRNWAVLAPSTEVDALADFVQEYVRRNPPQRYDQIEWRDGRPQWKTRTAGLRKADLESLLADLRSQAEANRAME